MEFRPLLLRWYRRNRRHLPWRQTSNPYSILLSEVMLQQTQVNRVRQKYPLFLKRFPTLKRLAESSPSDVIRAWQGMGYNRRALHLRACAKVVIQKFGGKIPGDVDVLQSLPGVGKYTAHAVACFAYSKRSPVVDVNIRRVLSRIFWKMRNTVDLKDADAIWDFAASLLPGQNVADWNQALMDFGATVCVSRSPRCRECPVAAICSSYKTLSGPGRRPASLKQPERLYDGLPVRIYRGRIIEHLRQLDGQVRIAVSKLAPLIKPNFSRKDQNWFNTTLKKLHNDGLIELQRRRNRLFARLPHA